MKARGRPRLVVDDVSINVHFRLASRQFDETHRHAQESRLSLAEWYRRAVTNACRDAPPARQKEQS